MKKRVKIGDVFAIPIDSTRYGYGQVIAKGYGSDCYVIFDIVAEKHPLLDKIVNKKVVILTFTLHQKIAEGEWIILGNMAVNQTIKIPEYLVEYMENGQSAIMVTHYDGQLIRCATEEEKENLTTKKSCTPSVLEDVVKAWYGALPWRKEYDSFIYKD